MLHRYYFKKCFCRLAWDFSVGQLSSKVLKSSQLVSSSIFTKIETCDWICLLNVLSIVGHMFGWSGPEPVAIWGCEPTRDETRISVPVCEDAYSRAARGSVPQPNPGAHIPNKKNSTCIWWTNTRYSVWNVKIVIRIIWQTSDGCYQ